MASLAYRCFARRRDSLDRTSRIGGVRRGSAGRCLCILVLGGIAVPAVGRLAAFVKFQRLAHRGSWSRALVFGGFWTAFCYSSPLVPWPCRVTAPLVIEPENAHRVYAVVAGTLASSVRVGDRVEKGQEVARLVNLDIRREIVELTGKRDQQQRQLTTPPGTAKRLTPTLPQLIPTAEAALTDLNERLRQRQLDEQSLVLRAGRRDRPAAGERSRYPAARRPIGLLERLPIGRTRTEAARSSRARWSARSAHRGRSKPWPSSIRIPLLWFSLANSSTCGSTLCPARSMRAASWK